MLAACAPRGAPHGPLVAADDAGDTARLAAPAARVVSLIPATTELLFAIGAGPLMVGRSHWDEYPPSAAGIADMGDAIPPNLERVVAARPDLVLLYRSAQNASAAARLREMGIPAVQLRTDLLADVPRLARLLGRLTGRDREGDSVARAFEAAMDSLPPPVDSTGAPSVLMLVWTRPPMTVGRGSFLDEAVRRAGGRNLYADLASSSAQISIESVAERDPDLILVLGDSLPAFASEPEWQVVRAVRERRFILMGTSALSYPGPRTPAAIRRLAARIAAARR